MRIITLLASLSALTLLVACGMQDGGYYDANGSWVAPTNATKDAQRRHGPNPEMNDLQYQDGNDYHNHETSYDRAGYYDYNGYYVTMDSRMSVPRDMFPPRGMCRVWLPNRAPENQPRVESCNGIQNRVPAGAYVVYGG